MLYWLKKPPVLLTVVLTQNVSEDNVNVKKDGRETYVSRDLVIPGVHCMALVMMVTASAPKDGMEHTVLLMVVLMPAVAMGNV